MKKGWIFFLGFIFGAGSGGLIVNTLLKQQYQQKADDQIAACQTAFLNELDKRRNDAELKTQKEKEVKEEASEAIENYSTEPEKAKEMIDKADSPYEPPYRISDEVFDDPANPYTAEGLTYFPEEGVVMRGDHSIMTLDDLVETIGRDVLQQFDDETDRIIMRNDKFQKDYEIGLSAISYTEWKKKNPGK